MKKIWYWSPHISSVATIKNVINSALSLKKFDSEQFNVRILDVIGEWSDFKEFLKSKNIEYFQFSNISFKNILPISGFIKSRFFYFLIFILKINELKTLLKKEKPDFLIIHLITIIPLFLLMFFRFKTKFILRISGLPKLTIFRKFFWKLISNKIYLITCPSGQTRTDLVNQNIFPEKKIKILYDPIINISEIQKNLNNQTDNIILSKNFFLNIGRLTKQKNQILLIKTFTEIIKKNNNLFLYIAGDGEKKKELKKIIKLNKMEKNIFLLGHIKNIYPIIKKSLAVISTSLWEDPGAVMIEASYCNKVVISSDCPNGPKEFLSFGKGGYLFKNNDKKDLIEKINMFLNDKENNIFDKIKLSKKESKNYSLFSHYKNLNFILNLK